MTMTPVHMHDHGHGVAASGLVIAIHIGAMYLPSPLTGWLVDRYGRLTIATASGLVLLAAGIVAASAPADSVPPATRAKTQGPARLRGEPGFLSLTAEPRRG